MKYNIHYFNEALYPGMSANKVARVEMANSFLRVDKVEGVFFWFLSNRYFFNERSCFANQSLDKGVTPKRVWVPFFSDPLEVTGTKIDKAVRFVTKRVLFLWALVFFAIKRFEKSDLVFIRGEQFVLAFCLGALLKNVKFSFEVHNYEFGKFFLRDFLYRRASKKANVIIVISGYSRNHMVRNGGIKSSAIVNLPSGVNIQRFSELSGDNADYDLRLEIGARENAKIAIYTGSLHKNRGIEDILFCAKKTPNIEFVIVGGNKSQIEEYLSKPDGDAKNIHFVGYKSNKLIPSIVSQGDVLLAPYSKKIKTVMHMSPVKLFEYAAAEKPVVVSNISAIREIFNDDEVNYFTPDDRRDLLRCTREVFDNYDVCLAKAGRAKRKAELHSWDNRAKTIFKLLKKDNEQK